MFLTTLLLWTVFSSVLPQEVTKQISNEDQLPTHDVNSEIQSIPTADHQIERKSVKPCSRHTIITKYLKEQGILPRNEQELEPNEDTIIPTILPTINEQNDESQPKTITEDKNEPIDTTNRRSNKNGVSIEVKENRIENDITIPCDSSVSPNKCIAPTTVNREHKTEAQHIEQKAIEIFEDCFKDKINKVLTGENDAVDTRRALVSPKENDDKSSDEDEENSVELSSRRDPASGAYVSNIAQTKVSLMQNPRICFACSTATNPTCWEPNRRTTVKYCNRNHNACVTKTFGTGASLTLIRDCANTCHDTVVPGIEPKYKSCSVCHSDLCNSAYSINSYNLLFILLIPLIKCTFY